MFWKTLRSLVEALGPGLRLRELEARLVVARAAQDDLERQLRDRTVEIASNGDTSREKSLNTAVQPGKGVRPALRPLDEFAVDISPDPPGPLDLGLHLRRRDW